MTLGRWDAETRSPERRVAVSPRFNKRADMANIRHFRELRVYQNAMDAAMRIFELTKAFPTEEKYSMVDQTRRSSRSVCANLAEAWRKWRYREAFVAKLSNAESEACETQV